MTKHKWKPILMDWDALALMEDDNECVVCLSTRERAILKGLLTTAYWTTRWENLGETEKVLGERMARLDSRLSGCASIGNDTWYLYWQMNLAFQRINIINWDGSTTSINENAPVDEWNQDEDYDGNTALCMGVQDVVAAMAAMILNDMYWRNEGIRKPFFDILQLVSDIIGLGFTYDGTLKPGHEWEVLKEAFQDEEAIRKIVCCITDNLKGEAVTKAVLATSGAGCGFGSGTNEWYVIQYIRRELDTDETYYAFLDAIGNAYTRVTVLNLNECPCDLIGRVTFDDAGTDLDYTKEYGYIASFGQPALALWGEEWYTPPETAGKRSEILIDLGADYTITQVKFLYNYMAKPGDDLRRDVYLYDDGMVLLDSATETDHQDFNTWHDQTEFFNEPDVRYIRVATLFNNDGYAGQFCVFDTVQVFGT